MDNMMNEEKRGHWRLGTHVAFGAGLVALGVLLFLDNLEFLDARLYLRFWPVFIILAGVFSLLRPQRGKFWGSVLVLIGIVFLLNSLNIADIGFREIWPLGLVLVGASLLWGQRITIPPSAVKTEFSTSSGAGSDPESVMSGVAILGAYNRANSSRDFRGGDLTAVLGGCEVDLRRAEISADSAAISVFAFWGGIKLRIPSTWRVSLQCTPILGGFEDRSIPPPDAQAKILIIRGTAIMGGVEITN
jgi:predicted membrane protein